MERYRSIRQIGLLAAIPGILLASPLIGFFIGNYLDSRLHTAPYVMLFFVILGFAAGVGQTILLIREAARQGTSGKERD